MKNNSNKIFWWLDFASHLLDWKTPRGFAGVILLLVPLYAGVWTIRESSGTAGSIGVVLEILATSAAILGASLLGAKLLRWPILYRAVYKYTELLLREQTIRETTVLVGEGAGGALAVGMVSKAIQELGYPVPLSIVIDCEFIDQPKPTVGVLSPKIIEFQAMTY
ncbi:MAG: hypothetical protein IPN04_09460 [Rhodoferax sp.]|nr:hypothetical protein [Rhodoferax sp.]